MTTPSKQHGGSRPGSGRKRSPTAQRNGETWVRLSHITRLTVNGVTFDVGRGVWWVGMNRFDTYASAAAEFVRRVNTK